MALLQLTVVVLFSVGFCPSQCLAQPLRVYVDGVKGNDSLECLHSSSIETPCQSLSFVADNLTRNHSVDIEILGDVLNLTRAVNFTDYSSLSITGSGNGATIHCNESGAGLAFIRVCNLSLQSLTIEKCGALRPSTSTENQTWLHLPVAVYVLNCTDLSIQSVDIVSSDGGGLSLYDTNGSVDIVNCNFISNTVADRAKSGGGGVHIEFTICSPGFTDNCDTHNDRNTNSRYNVQHCNFINNCAYSPSKVKSFIQPSYSSSVLNIGKGGGLQIRISLDATDNTFLVRNCTFLNNSASYDGGGMIVNFLNSARENLVSVVQNTFEGNKCTQTLFSGVGGILVAFLFYSQSVLGEQQPHNNSFECRYCIFKRNIGIMGGGTGLFVAKRVNQSSLSNVSFSNCNWTENESAMGAAVFISPGIWDYSKEGFLPVPKFTDCRFDSNPAVKTLKQSRDDHGMSVQSVGYGAVFISQLRVIFEGNTYFSSNNGSAVHLSNSVIEFTEDSDVILYNNTSHNGGAVAMYGSSMIQIANSSSFLFTNNRASLRGGAIYFDFNAATHPAYHNCFISSGGFSPVNSTLTFRNNSASASGDSVFTTTFQPCSLLCSGDNELDSPEEIMQCIGNFSFDDTNSSLSTRPEKFELNETLPLLLIPGTEYTLSLSATDEANTSLSGVVYEASVTSPNISIDPAFLQVSNNKVKVLGENGSTAKLELFTFDMIVSVDIELTECQPGYQYNSSSSECECAASEYLGLEGCDPKVYLKQGYWMGYCSGNGSELCTAYCPYGFCTYNNLNPTKQLHPLHDRSASLDSDICGPTRTGRLCGECSPGRTVHFNSWKHTCGSERLCDLGWLFYLLSVIVPLTLLFIVVLVFNISFTTGNANCFVLYGQLLGTLVFNGDDSIQFPYAIDLIQQMVTFPYKSFDLNFLTLESLSFCLWRGSTFMGMMMINYATVGFALILVLVSIFFTKYQCIRSKIFTKFQHRSSFLIHGISAFFVLCYSQASITTFHILHYSCLFSANFKCFENVVYRAGHMTYLGREHAPYAIVAFLVLLLMITTPPVLLLIYPLLFKLFGLCKLSETRLARMLWRAMPIQFLDAFQSSFKDRYRFFAGLYFTYRAAFLALYICFQSRLAFYSSVQLLLTVILTVHSLLQPHKERKHNIIDSLLFANLCLINAITLYYYGRTEVMGQTKSEVNSALAVVQAVLIVLPLVMVVILHAVDWKLSRKKRKDLEDLPSLRIDEKSPLIQK